MTASIWIGGIIAGLTFGKLTDRIGRRPALLWAAIITLFAVLLQTASQNIAMFVVARVFIGFGTSASGLTGPTWLAETLPIRWRAWGLGVFNDFYYVGMSNPYFQVSRGRGKLTFKIRWSHSRRYHL